MRTVRESHRKITPEQRHQLIQVYLNLGQKIAGEMCVEYGVSEKYAARESKEHGLAPRKASRGGGDIARTVNHKDHRWAWAIARGDVTA
jgi:hypothetical protein